MSNDKDNFNGYSYASTLAFFKYTLRAPSDVRNGETRGDWFFRCHGITGKDFAEIIKQREKPRDYQQIMGSR